MAAVSVYTACEVCGEVENRIHMAEVATDTYVHHGCKNDWEGPRGRTEDGALII